MKAIKDIDLAYIAGFIDGEGYVGYSPKKDRGKRHYTLEVKVNNTD